MGTLILVEARKAADTRGALVLLAVVVLLGAAAVVLVEATDPTLTGYVSAPGIPLAALLPVWSVLAVSGDRIHRTHLVGYAVEPRRLRVVVARTIAVVVGAVLVASVSCALAAGLFVVLHGGGAVTTEAGAALRAAASVVAIGLNGALTGVAAASVVRSVPLAIVLVVLGPVTIDVVAALLVPTVAPWISVLVLTSWTSAPSTSWGPVGDAPGVGQALASLGLWVVLPLVVGTVRHLREDLA